ncbi:hypothetical protein COBT_001260 [Conglomerata obtusa]
MKNKIKNYEIYEFETLESTQTYLKAKITCKEYLTNTLIIAKNQNKGIGRSNTHWLSGPGSATFSFAFKSTSNNNIMQEILAKIVNFLICNCNVHALIKWPNDVFVQGHKVCGVIIDRVFDFYVVGVGLNVSGQVGRYMSIKELTGTTVNINDFMQCVVDMSIKKTIDLSYYLFSKYIYYENCKFLFDKIDGNDLWLISEDTKKICLNGTEYSYDHDKSVITKKKMFSND